MVKCRKIQKTVCITTAWKVQIGDRISRGVGRVKDKAESNKNAALKGPSVTQSIMSMHRKDEKRDMKRLNNRKVTHLGGTQVVY